MSRPFAGNMQSRTKGFLLGALGAAFYGMNPLFALPLYEAGLSPDSVLFHRYWMGAAMLGLAMAVRRRSFRVSPLMAVRLAVAGVFVAASSLFLFLSYERMDAGVASTILFVYPVMVAVAMVALFREPIAPATVAGLVLASAGIVLLCQTDGDAPLYATGAAMALLSALFYAAYFVGVRRSALKTLSSDLTTFYVLLFGVSLFWIRLGGGSALQTPPTPAAWGHCLGLALFTTVIALVFTTKAIHLVGATPTAILGALEPVTAVFIGVAVFGEPLTWRLCLGIAAVVGAVTLVVARGRGGAGEPAP